ncbi:MAG: penicillin-binding transpeptidase domain-containing protein [Polyangiaceae bacterium]|nr:penicillin-binding transpeptidase domain-containing protein [Polyangiaceae bacterium]
MRRTWIAVGLGVPVAVGLVIFRWHTHSNEPGESHAGSAAIVEAAAPAVVAATAGKALPLLAGLDLTKIALSDAGATAPLPDGKTARLTIDAKLQSVANAVMARYRLPEAAVVMIDTASGSVLVYASHIEHGSMRDLCAEATAPAASVFKIVTGASLVDTAGLSPDERACYSGGEQRIRESDLVADSKKDKWCTTLGGAMGRSINTVFARFALQYLSAPAIEQMAKSLGFGAPLAFDVPVQPSALKVPSDPLGFARTAAGFWNTTLSPFHAAWLSATMARGGEPVRPHIVSEVVSDSGKIVWTASGPKALERAVKPHVAHAVATMMGSTVTDGTSFRAFHDPEGRPFLADVPIAGKTGTLTDAAAQRYYTWFSGFSHATKPASNPAAEQVGGEVDKPASPPVAIGVLVVNTPIWTIKANVLAREVLRAYFAEHNEKGVSMPNLDEGNRSVARKKRK